MTPEAIRSWQAMARTLSDNALHALLRGLRSGDERVAASPLYYALTCGEAMTAIDALTHAARIEHQMALATPTPILGLPGGLMQATDWRMWWHDPGEADTRYGALALEVDWELRRRLRCGPATVQVC